MGRASAEDAQCETKQPLLRYADARSGTKATAKLVEYEYPGKFIEDSLLTLQLQNVHQLS